MADVVVVAENNLNGRTKCYTTTKAHQSIKAAGTVNNHGLNIDSNCSDKECLNDKGGETSI